MSTVYSWILNSHRTKKIPLPSWTAESKTSTPSTSLDGVFLLNKGFVKLDNTPLTLNQNTNGIYTIADCVTGNILMSFLSLQSACDNIEGAWLNPLPYVASVQYTNVKTL